MRWFGVFLLVVLLGDGLWFFGVGLPRHPAAGAPQPPAWNASAVQQQLYTAAVERAGTQQWERRRIVATALALPVFALIFAGLGTLLRNADNPSS